MKGLRIDDPHPRKFKQVFDSVIDQLDRYYWIIDTQSGPFSITDKPNFRELDTATDSYYVAVPELENSCTGLWRPGVLQFSDLLVVDECTYLVGISGDEKKAAAAAATISGVTRISPEFFDLIQGKADCALLHLYGWWEAYSQNSHLMERIGQIKGASSTESDVLCRHLYPEKE